MIFKQFSYTEKKIEVRKMSMSMVTFVWSTAYAVFEKDSKNLEIRIVDCFKGEVDIFKGLDEFIRHGWNMEHEVNVYDWVIMHDNRNDKDYVKIIISDNADAIKGGEN